MMDTKVTTNATLGTTTGMIVHAAHLEARKPNTAGTVVGPVPGHGGDVWFVKHDDDGSVGAYCYDEWH